MGDRLKELPVFPATKRPKRPENKGGAKKEVYGFVFWIVTLCCYIAFLLWAFLPEHVLHELGVTYYPSKWWALAAPTWVCATVLFTYIFYLAINLINTEPLDSIYTVKDEHSGEYVEIDPFKDGDRIPPIADIPIDVVNKLLYQRRPLNEGRGLPRNKSYPSLSDISLHSSATALTTGTSLSSSGNALRRGL